MPDRPPRLEVFQKYDPPLYFVTFNTYHRKRLLANGRVHARFVRFAQLGEKRGIAVGRYVVMPDHVHLFVRHSESYAEKWEYVCQNPVRAALALK